MKYLLDTNTCIRHLNRRSPAIIDKLATLPPDEIAVCSVVKAELFAGAQKSQQPTRTLQRQRAFLDQFVSLPFDDAAADQFGRIRAVLEAAGTPIGPYDLQIAAIAPLFHPRRQEWGDHFVLQSDMTIEGRTPEGRTTVRVLQMNDRDRVENRQILAEIGEYPCAKE
jgi:tRNA(fMet)-specific endonuclease VapC